MLTRHRIATALVALSVVLFYLPTLRDSFTSDAFVWVRYVSEGHFLDSILEAFTQPFFQSNAISYYRPISNLIFALEYQWVGADPVGFHATSIAVHVANLLLVGAIAAKLLRSPRSGTLVAAVFALYPYHAGAVATTAYQATSIAALFLLGSTLLYLAHRERPRSWKIGLSLVSYALALGSYETALALPFLLVAWDILRTPADEDRPSIATRVRRHAPYFALLGIYLAARINVLGSIGAGKMTPTKLLGEVVRYYPQSVWRLLNPIHSSSAVDEYLQWAVWLLVPLVLIVRLRSPRETRSGWAPILWAFAWFSAFLAFAPNRLAEPSTGRFAYMSSIGFAIASGWLLAPALGGHSRLFAKVSAWALLASWGVLAARAQTSYRDNFSEAADIAASIQSQLVEFDATLPEGTRIFFGDYPYGLRRNNINVAQVYHWGLADSLRPPFTNRPIAITPLPERAFELFGSLLAVDGAAVTRWDDEQRSLLRDPGPPDRQFREVPTYFPDPDVTLAADDFVVVFPASGFAAYRIVVITAGNPLVMEVSAAHAHPMERVQPALEIRSGSTPGGVVDRLLQQVKPGDALHFRRPVNQFLTDTVLMFDDASAYWWVEGIDPSGRVQGFSGVRRLTLSTQPE